MVGIFRVVKPAHRDLETDEYRIAVADNGRVKDGMVYVRLDWLLGLLEHVQVADPEIEAEFTADESTLVDHTLTAVRDVILHAGERRVLRQGYTLEMRSVKDGQHKGGYVVQWQTPLMPSPAFTYYEPGATAEQEARDHHDSFFLDHSEVEAVRYVRARAR